MRDFHRSIFNRTIVTEGQMTFCELYPEGLPEDDIFNHLEAIELDNDLVGEECDLLDLVEFDSAYDNLGIHLDA